MKNLIQFFIENHKFTFIITLFLVIYGLLGLRKINSESYPSVSFATATVKTMYLGAGPDEIEEQITKPIEDEIRTVTGLKDVRSISQSGKSEIIIRVDMDNYDVDKVMDDLQKAVQRVSDLPAGIKEQPKFEELNSEEFPAIEIAVTGSNKGRKRDQFADYLKDLIEDNARVKGVRFSGFQEREFSVRLNQKRMDELHIGISEVFQALLERNQNIPAGKIERPAEQFLVKLDAKVENIEELKETFIRSNYAGKSIRLKDIATVEDSMEDPEVLARLNGTPATLLIVAKKAGEDTIALVKDIEAKLSRLTIPQGLEIQVYNNESKKVQSRMEVLSSNAITGLFFVVLFLFLFLRGWVGVFASMSLPLAVLGTIGMMPSFGMNLNAITILALVIALGMLVDNSVVISENFTRLLHTGMEPKRAALEAAHQFWLPISCTAFTTIAAFLPMLVTKGVMGEFIKYIPMIVSFSLALSLAESFFLLPARLRIAGRWRSRKASSPDASYSDWFSKVTTQFETFMTKMVRRRYRVLVIFTLLIFGSLFMLFKVNKFILFPAEQTEIYIGRFEAPRGTPVEKTAELGNEVSNKILTILKNDVQDIVMRAGISQTEPGDPKSKELESVGLVTIYMTREASFEREHTEVLDRLREIQVDGLEGLSFEAQINGPPVGNPVTATFRSNNATQLNELTNHLVAFMKKQDGIQNPMLDEVIGQDEIRVILDYEKLSRLNLNVERVGHSIKTALEGSIVTEINLNNKNFDLLVRLDDQDREELIDLANVKTMDARGNLVPLSTFAKLTKKSGTPIIKRFNFQRSKTLTADIDEDQITSIQANEILMKEYQRLKEQYPEVSVVVGGEQESTNESMDSLWEAMVLAMIGIFGILVFLFRSYARPLIIMSTIPLGLFGFAIAFYFHQRPVSFLSLIGVIGLSGIIVNSGIVLISFIDDLRNEGKLPLDEILVKASGQRLRAVVVTSLTTVSGLFPTAYGIGGHDLLLIPMTLAMAWGLTSGTILTLAWVPCAYAILEDMTSVWQKLKEGFSNRIRLGKAA